MTSYRIASRASGPLDKMLALRKKLECKPFSWFMEQVYPTNIFKDPTEIAAISDVRNEGTNKCLDTLGHGRYSTLTTHTTVLSIHPFFF